MNLATEFDALVLDYQDRLYRFALRLTACPADAEEIAQDAFVRAYRWLAANEAPRELRPWLYRVALNVFRNRARRKQLDARPLGLGSRVSGLGSLASADEGELLAPAPDPAFEAERAETRAELALELAALPGRYREAVVLRHVEELSYPEIADVLGRPLGSVKSDVHRGLALLRAAMDANGREVRAG